jgi:hypothetical protein
MPVTGAGLCLTHAADCSFLPVTHVVCCPPSRSATIEGFAIAPDMVTFKSVKKTLQEVRRGQGALGDGAP